MYLNVTYDVEFDELIMHLKSKYPSQLFDIDGIGMQLDMNKFSKNFFKNINTADASIDSNANVSDSTVISYHHELPKPFFKLNSYFMLWKSLKQYYNHEIANRIIEMQISGDIYINDVHGIGGRLPYCYNYSTYDIALKGLPMITKIKSIAPKYLYSFKSQVEQFTIIAANSTLGATGLADFLIVFSWYVDKMLERGNDAGIMFDTSWDEWKYVAETLISFIYTINQPSRGNQSCFVNISIYDDYFLDDMLSDYIFPDGTIPNKETVKDVQNLFLKIMNKEMSRTPITFPIVTACFNIDENNKIKDNKFKEMIAEYNLDYGFINMFFGKTSTISSCCRLRSDTNNEYFNSFGVGSSKIGSLGVVTINLPRLAKRYSNDEESFYKKLSDIVLDCARINNVKRKLINEAISRGYHPLYSLGFIDINRQYSTVGINGFNECIENLNYNPLDENGIKIGLKIIETINTENNKCQNKYKAPHNCEQIPGESASIKLAKKDEMLGFNDKYIMYSNQFIPLTVNADMLDRIELQGVYDKYFSGGSVCHINIENKLDSKNKLIKLMETCAEFGVIYCAVNYNIQECENGHMVSGKHDNCQICNGKIINDYTRVVGFLTNVKNWIKERREQDYPNRQFY